MVRIVLRKDREATIVASYGKTLAQSLLSTTSH